MDIPEDVMEVFMNALKNPDITKERRAEIIGQYKEKTGLSNRKLGEVFNMPYSTIQDYLNPKGHGNSERKREYSAEEGLERFIDYIKRNEKYMKNKKHLKKIKQIITTLEKIKTDIEFKTVQGEL